MVPPVASITMWFIEACSMSIKLCEGSNICAFCGSSYKHSVQVIRSYATKI